MNLLTVGSRYSEEIYDRAFWYKGKKLRCGTPRCDLFFNEKNKKEIVEKLYKYFNISYDKKIILYAPTFKKNTEEKDLNYEKIINELNKLSKTDNYIFLIRLHPISKRKIKTSKNVIDVTNYPDIQELIIFCDYMITDYSGCCFDAMFAKKPCILYTPDFNDYINKERKLAIDFNDLPFERIYDEKSLIDNIINFNYINYINKINQFLNKIGNYENGTASKQIADVIDKIIGDDKNEKI